MSNLTGADLPTSNGFKRGDGKAFRLAGMALAAIILIQPASLRAYGQSNEDDAIPVGVGILNATDYQPIAKGSGFDTVVQNPNELTGSALDNAILERVNGELVAHGYRVDHNSPLVMLVGGDLVRGTSKDAVVDKIKGIGGAQNEHQGNVFSTNGDTLLTKTVPDTHPNTFRISLSIYDRKTGIYVWRGSMDRGTSNLTPDQATDRMVPPLVNTIGRAEQNRRIDIGATE